MAAMAFVELVPGDTLVARGSRIFRLIPARESGA
jgi:hypothetical protein